MTPLRIPEAVHGSLRALSRNAGVTLYMTLLTAFLALLHRLTGQPRIAVGSPIANRNHHQLEGIIGFFVNTLVMPADLSDDPSFHQLLAKVRDTALSAYAHQDLPFEKLVEELEPERDLSQNPLFQILFALQNAPEHELELPGVRLEALGLEFIAARFDLELHLVESGERLDGAAIYNADLFDATTIRRLTHQYPLLLDRLTADPQQRLSDLSLIDDGQRHQLLREWSAASWGDKSPEPLTAHEIFSAQARTRPDSVALTLDQGHLSYRELDRRSDRLAAALRRQAARPETAVGVFMERSFEMVMAMLGTFKAGGILIPLDPSYPRERLAFVLDEALPRPGDGVILSQKQLASELPDHPARLFCLDSSVESLDLDGGQGNVAADPTDVDRLTFDRLAYVIYTSGSTGRPKGVAMRHRILANLISWQSALQADLEPAKTLQFASLSFDICFQEMFPTWRAGGTVVLIRESLRRDPRALLDLVRDRALSQVFLPVVALQQLAESAPPEISLPRLQQVFAAGEQLRITRPVARFFEALPHCRLFNHYGPTECHVVTTQTLAAGGAKRWPTLPPIGRPVASTDILLLDRYLQSVPIGMAGEVCIGGANLARGYLHRPGQTAERFVPDPRSHGYGRRLYVTGDLVRTRADGSFEFLGRIDRQVKIRGFRVEIGEIETLLEQQPTIQQAVVLAQASGAEHTSRDTRLIAYLVDAGRAVRGAAAPLGQPAAGELRAALGRHLPRYMVPSGFVALPALPVDANGKVDRATLVRNAAKVPWRAPASKTAPRTPAEEILTGIWSQVLGIQDLGVHDNFFDLGGHSLLATQVLSRIRRQFGVDLPLRILFDQPTVAELAASGLKTAVAGDGPRDDADSRVLHPVPRNGELPLSFAQQRLWFLHQLEPTSPAYNQPAAFRLRGRLDRPALTAALGEIVHRHEGLRTRFPSRDGQPRQAIDPAGRSLPLIDLSELAVWRRRSESQRLIDLEAVRPFDLARGPVQRLLLLKLTRREHLLFVCWHHIASDGWSHQVFSRELSMLYRAATSGRPSPLPELGIQYADYAVWQRRWLEDGQGTESPLRRQLAYWRRQLGGGAQPAAAGGLAAAHRSASATDAQLPGGPPWLQIGRRGRPGVGGDRPPRWRHVLHDAARGPDDAPIAA